MKRLSLISIALFLTIYTFGQTANECFNKGNQYKNAKEYDKAFEWYSKGAEMGDAKSQYELGLLYQLGNGVTKNSLEAEKWWRKSANQGELWAIYSLGLMYDNGDGVMEDNIEAVKWYRKAAEQGYLDAQVNLGIMLVSGEGIPKDGKEAAIWLEKASNQGSPNAMYVLGAIYVDGKVIEQDYTKGKEYLQKAADKGYVNAMLKLGKLYEAGESVEQSFTKAEEWYKKALSIKPDNTYAKKYLTEVQEMMKSTQSKALPNLEIVENSMKFVDPSGFNAIRAEGKYTISFQLKNIGKGVGVGCVVKVEAKGSSEDIKVKDMMLRAIEAGETATIEVPITSGVNTKNGQVDFVIKVDEPNGFGTDPQFVTVNTRALEAPMVKITDYSLTSVSGKTLRKKQPFDLQLMLQNVETGQADDVTVTIDLPDDVMLIDGRRNEMISKLTGGEAKSFIYSLIVNNNYTATTIPVKVHLKEKYGKYAEDRTINLSLDQHLASTKISVNEVKQKSPTNDIVIAQLGSYVDKDIPQASIKQEKTFAVIIANENYEMVAPVPYAVNDGTTFEAYCRQALGIPNDNIHLLTDATLGKMKREVDWLRSVMKAYNGEAQILFYYAGHGIPNEQTGNPFLLPVDGYGSNTSTGYALNDLYHDLEEFPTKSVTVFLDACFSGAKREGDMLTSARGVAMKVNRTKPNGNLVSFSAAQGDETAYPMKDEKHGMFTYFLLKKFKETKGELTLGELYDYIKTNVMQQSVVKNGKMQTPDVNPSGSISNSWRDLRLK